METIYLVKARHTRGKAQWLDWWLVRATSADQARMMVFNEAQRSWNTITQATEGHDFFYKSMRITRALGEKDDLRIIHQEEGNG